MSQVAHADTGNAAVATRYAEYCSVCHGDNGDGNSHATQGMKPPPRDFTDPALAPLMTKERMAVAIRDGRPGTAMIAWGSALSDAEIDELAQFIVENFVSDMQPDNDHGAFLYRETCSVCHGDDGTGAIWGQESLASAPRNFQTADSRRVLSRERMIAAVAHGLPGTPMTGFDTQLTAEQIDAVVDFVRSEFMQVDATNRISPGARSSAAMSAVAVPLASDFSLAFPNGLQGDAESGMKPYMENCVACHGADGNGNGPRAYFIFPKPRNFLDPATRQRMNRPALFSGIKDGVIGKEMPAWGKVMSDQEIADIAEFVYTTFIE